MTGMCAALAEQLNSSADQSRFSLSTCCRAGSRVGQAREPRGGQNIRRLLSGLLASLRMGPPSVWRPGHHVCLALARALACCVPSLHRGQTPASCIPREVPQSTMLPYRSSPLPISLPPTLFFLTFILPGKFYLLDDLVSPL